MKIAISKKRKSMGAKLGQLGGNACVKKFGKAHMKRIGKLGAKARWGKNKKK